MVDVSDPELWKQQWAALMSAPYIMLPLLAVVAMVAWWVRGKMSEETIAGQRERIALFDDRLKFAADKAASANQAKEEVEKQFQAYKAEVAGNAGQTSLAARAAKIDAAIEELSAANNAVSSAVGVALDAAEAPLVLRVAEIRADKRWNLWSKLKRHLN